MYIQFKLSETNKKLLIDSFNNISQTTLVKQVNLKCENLN